MKPSDGSGIWDPQSEILQIDFTTIGGKTTLGHNRADTDNNEDLLCHEVVFSFDVINLYCKRLEWNLHAVYEICACTSVELLGYVLVFCPVQCLVLAHLALPRLAS